MFIIKDTLSFTASTAAGSAFYTTAVNGCVHSIVTGLTTKPLKAKAKLTICVESSLGPPVLTVAPTTVSTVYYPRRQTHGSTGAVLGSSDAQRTAVPLFNERLKVNVAAASSINHINGVLYVYYS